MYNNKLGNLVYYYQIERDNSKGRLSSLQSRKDSLSSELLVLEKVNKFFQDYIQYRTNSTKKFIEDIVNRGLVFVFEDDISIEILTDVKHNKVVYDVVVHDKRSGIAGGKNSHGGGVWAVVAFIFKFVASYLTHKIPLLVEDESLADVSFHYQEKLSAFIKELCRDFQYDLLLISHQEALNSFADVSFELEKIKSVTVIKNIKTEGGSV